MAPQILVVDDEARYLHLVKVNLEAAGYEVKCASNGEEALEMMSNQSPDLVILDIMMPRLDGFTTCERIRQFSNVPIIMLTAKGEEQDRVKGLNVGADDYVVKPFSATELVARVRAVLRRAQTTDGATQNRYFTHGNLKIDFARAEVWKDNKPVYLSATEYRLLIQFAHHVGHVLSAEDLLIAVWGSQYKDDKEILWVSIARLRQKLEDNPHSPQHIVTRSGLGYLMPPLEKEATEKYKMVTHYDEKGKIFTQVVSKHPVQVIIQTIQNTVRGTIYIRPDSRVKDDLNGAEHFMAVTNAVVFNSQNEELYHSTFMVVNTSHIIWVIPEEEITP